MLDIRKSSAVLSKYISTKDKLSLDSQSAIRKKITQFKRYKTLGKPGVSTEGNHHHVWCVEDWSAPVRTVLNMLYVAKADSSINLRKHPLYRGHRPWCLRHGSFHSLLSEHSASAGEE